MAKTAVCKKGKALQIKQALNAKRIDYVLLRNLALTQYGFVSSELRRKVWPQILGLDINVKMPSIERDRILAHRDFNQVELDVNRSIKRFPIAMKEAHRSVLQEQLTALIMKVLVNNPDLHYYQGFHDVCVTFLLILGQDISFLVVDHLAKNHLRDFMDVDMARTRTMLNYLYPILKHSDKQLHDYMIRSGVGTIFCLSWLITWYGHALDNAKHIVRLYDFFLASHPLMPIYLAASIVLHRREEVLSTECEMCFIHVLLSRLPDDLPFETLIQRAVQLFYTYMPEDLARDADFDYETSQTIKNYSKFEKVLGVQDSHILNKKLYGVENPTNRNVSGTMLKVTMWTLSAAVGFAFLAMQYVSRDYM